MFYCFVQNNSGGDFNFSLASGISRFVIIEAANAKEANECAKDIGLYFKGCENNVDCDCCGDRWYEVEDTDGTVEPTIYGTPVNEFKPYNFWMTPDPEGFIHYADGFEPIFFEKR